MTLFETLEIQPKPISVPFEYFHAISASIAKHEQRPVEWIQFETVLYDHSQSIDRLSHVRVPAREENALAI
jgi:hypothetical protein